MSDVEIPVYVARAQAGSAIHLVVQLARFAEDGSRRITRIAEVRGLDRENNFQIADLFAHKVTGRTPQGAAVAELAPTGLSPSFREELSQYGLDGQAKLTQSLWTA
jgi:pilus assembly protein CpaF